MLVLKKLLGATVAIVVRGFRLQRSACQLASGPVHDHAVLLVKPLLRSSLALRNRRQQALAPQFLQRVSHMSPHFDHHVIDIGPANDRSLQPAGGR